MNARAELYGRDSGWNLTLWVKNLTDAIYRTAQYGDGLYNNWFGYKAPGIYGVTLSCIY